MDWGLALSTTATGLIVVFAVLILLVIIISLLGKLMDSLTNRTPKRKKKKNKNNAETAVPAEQPKVVNQASVELDAGVDDEVVAAISAAVAVILSSEGKGFRLKSIKRTKESRPVWSAAGIRENTRPF